MVPGWTDPSGLGRFYLLLAPADFAVQYSIPPTANGAGVTIGIVGLSNVDMSLVAAYRNLFNLNSSNLPTVVIDGVDPGIINGSCWQDPLLPERRPVQFSDPRSDVNVAAVLSVSYLSCESSLGAPMGGILLRYHVAAEKLVVFSVDANGSGPETHLQFHFRMPFLDLTYVEMNCSIIARDCVFRDGCRTESCERAFASNQTHQPED
jgi:hypothetical protein